MDDKKTNPTTPENNGSPTDLKKEAAEQQIQFGSTGSDDINKNLGSFGKTVHDAQEPTVEVKLDVDAKVVEKASKEKINFERFSKTKKPEKAAKTKFGEKVSLMLRSKKGFVATWVCEIVLMVVIIAISIVYVALMTRYKNYSGDGPLGQDSTIRKCLKVGLVFSWISMFPCFIPLIYLLTTWFIGINQVARSRTYHYMFWICALVSLCCFIVATGLLIGPMNAATLPMYH